MFLSENAGANSPVPAINPIADEPKLNEPLSQKRREKAPVPSVASEPEQVYETAEHAAETLSMLGLQLAKKRLLKLCPVIGKAVADARAPIGQREARLKQGADSLPGHQIPLGKSSNADRQCIEGQAEFTRKVGFSRSRSGKNEQDCIVSRLQTLLQHGNQQCLVRQLARLYESVKCRSWRRSGHRRENSPNSCVPSMQLPSYR